MRISDWSSDVCSSDLSASVKGYANSSSFAMGKFGLRGLCQSLARELQPRGIHVAHFVIDGGIGRPRPDGAQPDGAQPDDALPDDALLAPDAIAETYLHVHQIGRASCRVRVCQYV